MPSERRLSSGATLRSVDNVSGDSVAARIRLDPERVAAVGASGLLDSAPELVFDELVELARTFTGAHHAEFTVIDAHRCYRKNTRGPGDPGSGTLLDSIDWSAKVLEGPLVVADVVAEARIRETGSPAGVGALCCVPVEGFGGWVIGALIVGEPAPRSWSDEEVHALTVLARSISNELRFRRQLVLEEARARHPTGPVDPDSLNPVVRVLQHGFLPAMLPHVQDADVSASYRPAGPYAPVHGDFYDLFATGNYWCAVIGDVASHGVDAARLMALARYTIRAQANHHPDPRFILEQLHQALLAEDCDTFVTATVAVLRPDDTGGLIGTVSSGGHEPALVRRAGGAVETLQPEGVLLGVMPRSTPPALLLNLAPGDLLLLYTDGVTTARPGRGGPCFGDGRLIALLEACPGDPDAQTVVDRVMDAVDNHAAGHYDDDIAVLAVKAVHSVREQAPTKE